MVKIFNKLLLLDGVFVLWTVQQGLEHGIK